jgi:hypothetical protein
VNNQVSQSSNSVGNCPVQFFNNCKNASVKCQYCAAFNPSRQKNLYEPINTDDSHLEVHPYVIQRTERNENKPKKDRVISRRVKQALKDEEEFCKYLQDFVDPNSPDSDSIARCTLASGSIAGDGDIQVLEGLIQIDHKRRSTKSKTFALSDVEYQKGKNQGTNCWVIKRNADQPTAEQIVMLTPEAFAQLVKLAHDSTNSEGNLSNI